LNCLACEYPDYWRKTEPGSSADLELQSKIYEMLASMPQSKIKELGKMCYDAAMDECLDLSRVADFTIPGTGFREKKNKLVDKIKTLKPRSNIAFPPIPLGEIKGYTTDYDSIQIGDHIFEIPTNIVHNETTRNYEMSSGLERKLFLDTFPATGLISYDDAKILGEKLDESPLQTSGYSHQGPCSSYDSPNPKVLEVTNSIYSISANAQFAEIRSDIARIVQQSSWPKPNQWNQSWIYKNKVCLWYSSRDAPQSPDGYRIDWFAISKFEVAGSIQLETRKGERVFFMAASKVEVSRDQTLSHGTTEVEVYSVFNA